MSKRKRQANYSNQYQITRLILMNLASTVVSMLLCICLVSVLSLKMDLDEAFMYYFTFPIIAVCAFCNGFIMAHTIRIKGWLVGLAANLIFLLILIISHFVVGETAAEEAMFLVKIGLILMCGVLGGIVGVNKKRKIK